MKKIMLFIGLILIIGVVGIYFYTQQHRESPAISTTNWLTYDGGTWIIKYPQNFTTKIRSSQTTTGAEISIVNFYGPNNESVNITVHTPSEDPFIAEAMQNNPKDVLGALIDVVKHNTSPDDIINTEKLNINNQPAAMIAYAEYVSTTFGSSTIFPDITVSTVGNDQNFILENRDIYSAMLSTFKFK